MDQAQRERVIQGLGACLEPRGERERGRERETQPTVIQSASSVRHTGFTFPNHPVRRLH